MKYVFGIFAGVLVHPIVHKGGIVDHKYFSNTDTKLKVEEKLFPARGISSLFFQYSKIAAELASVKDLQV